MDSTTLADRLAETALAGDLSRDELETIVRTGTLHRVEAGTVLLEEGLDRGALLVVLDGEVEVIKEEKNGGEQCIATLGPDSVLGEMGLVRHAPATATVRTTRGSNVFELRHDEFQRLADGGDPAAFTMTMAIARILADRLARMNEEAVRLCDRYQEDLEAAGNVTSHGRVEELSEFRSVLSQWNF